jgi:predicted DsbA family dithiol-disulfide isomerase
MALESPKVVADVIEIQEFPQLARLYQVMAVPKTVINDAVEVVGAVPEETLLEQVMAAVGEQGAAAGGGESASVETTPSS